MGNSARLDAVLRAGETRRLMGASYSGAPGDNSIKYAKSAKSAIGAPGDLPKGPTKMKSSNSVIANDPGAMPVLNKAKSTPAAPQGYQMRSGGGSRVVKVDSETGNQIVAKSSELVKDIVSGYAKGQDERSEVLRKARADAEACAKRRVDAVNKYRDEEGKAARNTISKLEEMLKKVEASRDALQNASVESARNIEKITREGGETSKLVEELRKSVGACNAQKASVMTELEALKVSSNEARDIAKREADAKQAKLEAAWKLKLDEALAAAKAGDVKSSKELAECTRKLEKATEDLQKETKERDALEKSSSENAKKFHAAAKAACDALSAYTKEHSGKAASK